MEQIKIFFRDYTSTILTIIVLLAAMVLILQWLMWLFKVGRFKPSNSNDSSNSTDNDFWYVIANFVKLINDFKHLLALIIIMIFAWVLIYSVMHAINLDKNPSSQTNFENLKDVMQAVVASLGGIVGSIIGYYFGESAAKGKSNETNLNAGDQEVEQNPDEVSVPSQAPTPHSDSSARSAGDIIKPSFDLPDDTTEENT